MHRNLMIPCLAAAAAAAPCASRAAADVVVDYTSDLIHSYRVTYMPDFDQRREFLPYGGNSYCVPTSVLDVLTFAARHGFPELFPGDESYWYWASQAAYPAVDAYDLLLGNQMGTDLFTGTTYSGAVSGMDWAGLAGSNGFVRMGQQGNRQFYDEIANWAMAGALVLPKIGWFPNLPVTVRDGGHLVALAQIDRYLSDIQIGLRDPAADEEDGSDYTVQSPFATTPTDLVTTQVQLLCCGTKTMNKLTNYSSRDTLALLDGYFALLPVSGFATSPDQFNLLFRRPRTFPWDSFAGQNLFPDGMGQEILTTAFAPHSPHPFFVTSDGVYRLHLLTGEITQVVGLQNGTTIAFGRTPRLYTLEEQSTVRCFDVAADQPAEEASTVIPAVDAMDYDDTTDRLVAFSAALHQLLLLPPDLQGSPGFINLPDMVTQGRIYMAVSPADGRIWIGSTQTAHLYLIRVITGGAPIVEEHTDLVAEGGPMQVNDAGHLLVAEQGIVKEFQELGTGWAPVDDSLFAGWQVGNSFCITRSRNDYDPAVHDGPEYVDVPPEVTPPGNPDCAGDVDMNNSVDIVDLLAVLAAWDTDDVDADQAPPGGDGVVGIQDFLLILAHWGVCP